MPHEKAPEATGTPARDAPAPPVATPLAGLPGRLSRLAAWGPGLLVMLAGTDVGNVVTASQAGTQWGSRLLPLLLLLIPVLYMVQELAARLGLATGQGFGALVRRRFGRRWAGIAALALAVATLTSLVTEFGGIAGVARLYGVPTGLALGLAALCLVGVVLSGAYRRVERVALAIGVLELSFVAVAWRAHPGLAAIARDMADQRLGTPAYLTLAAALIGATFNPWMIFYQPSALVEKGLGPAHRRMVRWDTALGAVLTQAVTAAILLAAAATLGAEAGHRGGLESVGQISEALTPLLGVVAGRLVFSLGVVGAAMVAAVVSSLALAWGLAELAGAAREGGRDGGLERGRWFRPVHVASVVGGALLVLLAPDLVRLSIAAQVVNAVLMPVLMALLIALAATALPSAQRAGRRYLLVVAVVCAVVAACGLLGAASGFL